MKQDSRYRLRQSAVLALGLVFLLTMTTFADDPAFQGKWKGETKITAAPAGSAPGAPGAGAAAAAPARGATAGGPAAGGAAPQGGGGGGARSGGGGGRGGGFAGGGFGGPQKVALNLKQSKDNKISGNITFGEGEASDVKDGKVDGNVLTFKAGRAPQPIYEYKAELKNNELVLTRNSPDARGGRPTEFVLSKK